MQPASHLDLFQGRRHSMSDATQQNKDKCVSKNTYIELWLGCLVRSGSRAFVHELTGRVVEMGPRGAFFQVQLVKWQLC